MSMMVSFVLSFFPRDVLDEILNLIESVSEDFPSYSYHLNKSDTILNLKNNASQLSCPYIFKIYIFSFLLSIFCKA